MISSALDAFQTTSETRISFQNARKLQEIFEKRIAVTKVKDYLPKYLRVIANIPNMCDFIVQENSCVEYSCFALNPSKKSENGPRSPQQLYTMLHIKHQRRVIAGYPDFNVLHSSLSSGIF
jgi:hypothetical protein